MDRIFSCHCGKPIAIDENDSGTNVICPSCGASVSTSTFPTVAASAANADTSTNVTNGPAPGSFAVARQTVILVAAIASSVTLLLVVSAGVGFYLIGTHRWVENRAGETTETKADKIVDQAVITGRDAGVKIRSQQRDDATERLPTDSRQLI